MPGNISQVVQKTVSILSVAAPLYAPIVAYTVSVSLLYKDAILRPTRNVTQFDLILSLIVVLVEGVLIVLPILLLLVLAVSSESEDSSDNQSMHSWISIWKLPLLFLPLLIVLALSIFPHYFLFPLAVMFAVGIATLMLPVTMEESSNQKGIESFVGMITGISTRKKYILRLVVLFLLLSSFLLSSVLVASNYKKYDEYNGGAIICSNGTYQDDVQREITFSDLNSIDKRLFRMTVNNSYLVSKVDGLSKTEEYYLIVTKDRGYDEVIIDRGGDPANETFRSPPDELSNKPTIDISKSGYFSSRIREKHYVKYQGKTYRCYLDEFSGGRGA